MGAMAISMILFYLLPTLVEIVIAGVLGDSIASILWGDAVGCAFIAALHRKAGIGLYLLLAMVETALLSNDLVRPSTMVWLTDLLPAAVLAGIAGIVTVSRASRDAIAHEFDGSCPTQSA